MLEQFEAHEQRSFVVEAPVGAGKTDAALMARQVFLQSKAGALTVIVAPNVNVLRSWLKEIAPLGLRIGVRSLDLADRYVQVGRRRIKLERIDNVPPPDLAFWAMTYQGISARGVKETVRRITCDRFVVAIVDEVHRLETTPEDDEVPPTLWGPACEYAFAPARKIIALSATPFRTRGRVSFLNENADGFVDADYRLPRAEAVDEGYICGLGFSVWDSTQSWTLRSRADGSRIPFKANISDPRLADQALANAFENEEFVDAMLAECIRCLGHVRQQYPAASGMIVCDRQVQAKAIATRLGELGQTAFAAISELGDSQAAMDALRDFQRDDDFMVTVGMAREGCNIPRLKVLGWMTRVKTLQNFIQTTGRPVRDVGVSGLEAICVLPEHPILVEYANNLLDVQTPPEHERDVVTGDDDDGQRERRYDKTDSDSENTHATSLIDAHGGQRSLDEIVTEIAERFGVPVSVAADIHAAYGEPDASSEATNGSSERNGGTEEAGKVRDRVVRYIRRLAKAPWPKGGLGIEVNEIKVEATGRIAKVEGYSEPELRRLEEVLLERLTEYGL
jgi:superfamily II DNA or RNA helicase